MNLADGRISRIEDYLDASPRTSAEAEQVGPFTLFVGTGPWPYYARPARHLAGAVSVADVHHLRARQREIDVPEEIEWQDAVTPTLAAACVAAGMAVYRFRLLALPEPLSPQPLIGHSTRVVDPAEDLIPLLSTQQQAFDASARVAPAEVDHLRAQLRTGATVAVVGPAQGRPACVGMHQPVGDVTEVVGVSTRPADRRRGWAGDVTCSLVSDAVRRGSQTVFLSAASDAVARVYERVGFRDLGVVCAAEPATPRAIE